MIQQFHCWVYIQTKLSLKKIHAPPIFIAALFTIAKTWKQCPLTDDQIRKMWYIYTMEYYSAINKNKIMPFAATWMELEILILSEEKERQLPYNITYIQNLIYGTNEPTYRKETNSQTQRTDLWLPRRSGMDGEFGVSRCKLLHLEWISNEVLLYSTGNYPAS